MLLRSSQRQQLKLVSGAMCPSWARECLAKTKSSWFGTPASALDSCCQLHVSFQLTFSKFSRHPTLRPRVQTKATPGHLRRLRFTATVQVRKGKHVPPTRLDSEHMTLHPFHCIDVVTVCYSYQLQVVQTTATLKMNDKKRYIIFQNLVLGEAGHQLGGEVWLLSQAIVLASPRLHGANLGQSFMEKKLKKCQLELALTETSCKS